MNQTAEPKTRTATEMAYATLKAMIMDNELQPSASYLEGELAERLGISRTPTREAMLQLERDGFVEVRPRHGMRVLPISAQDMQEIYAILTELEPLAAELAARRGLSSGELGQMQACVDAMDAALRKDDLDEWARADDRFHTLLAEYSGNQRLQRALANFADQVYRARMATLRIREKPIRSNEDHRELLDCLQSGDAGKAREVHRRHRETAGQMLVDLIARYRMNNL